MEDQLSLAKVDAQHQIESIKDVAKHDIILKRRSMKEKILSMRRKNDRKKKLLKQQLMAVRTEMAENLQKATKKGSKGICKDTRKNTRKINAYCENNFFDNYAKLSDCKDTNSFCYVCCENEFGDVYLAEREECYTMCDKKEKEPVRNFSRYGRWQWAPDFN